MHVYHEVIIKIWPWSPPKKKKKEKKLKRKVLSLDGVDDKNWWKRRLAPPETLCLAFFVLKLLKEVGLSVMWKKKFVSKLVNVRTAAEIVWLESP